MIEIMFFDHNNDKTAHFLLFRWSRAGQWPFEDDPQLWLYKLSNADSIDLIMFNGQNDENIKIVFNASLAWIYISLHLFIYVMNILELFCKFDPDLKHYF